MTVTLAVIAAASCASFTLPASQIQGRLAIAALVSFTAVGGSAACVVYFSESPVTWDVGVAVITAAGVAVAVASSWAVGVMVSVM